MTYQVALDYNETGSLADINPQPATPGVEPGRFTIGGDGHTYEDGFPSITFEWKTLTSAQLETLFSQFGFVGTVRSVEVTIHAKRNHDREFSDWNGIARYPQFPREGAYRNGFWRNVSITVGHLVGLDEGAYY